MRSEQSNAKCAEYVSDRRALTGASKISLSDEGLDASPEVGSAPEQKCHRTDPEQTLPHPSSAILEGI